MKELAIASLNYLTGKGGDFTPLDKDEYISSSNPEAANSLESFRSKMMEQAGREGIKEGNVTYDVVYGLEHKGEQVTVIINMTDYVEVYLDKEQNEWIDEILNRKINSVVIEKNGVAHEIDLSDLKTQLYDYAPLHERIYRAYNKVGWNSAFNWDGIYAFKRHHHWVWSKFQVPAYENGGTMPSFSEFQKQTKEELKKYLRQKQSEDFMLSFVEGKLDTAHLYGMNESQYKRK